MSLRTVLLYSNRFLLVLIAIAIVLSRPTFAQPSLQAYLLDEPPVLDGIVLEDSLWQSVVPGTNFQQVQTQRGHAGFGAH